MAYRYAEDVLAGEGRKPFVVTEAIARMNGYLSGFPLVILGEVSEVNAKRGYSAVYFTIKDQKSSLPCMMWNTIYERTSGLRVGMKIEVAGQFDIYAPKGRMSFKASSFKIAGEGNLRQKVDALARALRSEGLMDDARKRPVPRFPEKVCVVTSPRGDAVRDVLRTLRRRFPLATVSVAGVPVEGKTAAEGMVRALAACALEGCDVILLVRGGGSFEDLMPFNDEALARAVAASPVPVVTGIGHEPDTTIADMVSDHRASTPTAAAEAVSPSPEQMNALFASYAERLSGPLGHRLERTRIRLDAVAGRPVFRDSAALIAEDLMRLDMASDRLHRALPESLARNRTSLDAYEGRLRRSVSFDARRTRLESMQTRLNASGKRILDHEAAAFGSATERMRAIGATLTSAARHDLALRAGHLHDLSPLSILSRGYAMATDKDGHVVKHADAGLVGSAIKVRVSDGVLDCSVESVSQERRGS